MSKFCKQNPVRFRKARADAMVGSVEAMITNILGVPGDAVIFRMPSGRKQRWNSTIQRLRKNWAA